MVLSILCYFSKKFTIHQIRYSKIEKEALSLLLALQHFEVYIGSNSHPNTVHTDHNPLVFLKRMQNLNQRLMRWSLTVQDFNLNTKHKKGAENSVADALSREKRLKTNGLYQFQYLCLSVYEGKRCPDSWMRFGCSCYYKSTEKKTWNESRSFCQENGSDLVVLNSKEEQVGVFTLVPSTESWIDFVSFTTLLNSFFMTEPDCKCVKSFKNTENVCNIIIQTIL
uniref:C-type lectin domain-containing protein n=1 Tax=Oryzias latipes TaxID=8090 RepID=A0A3P9KTU4_ORYLA